MGTHLDAPYHGNPEGATVDAVDLAHVCGEAVWLDVSTAFGPRALVTSAHLEQALAAAGVALAPIVLLYTGWSRNREDPRRYFRDSMGLSEEAAVWLRERGTLTVGVDAPSVDPGGSAEVPAHMNFFRPRPGEPALRVRSVVGLVDPKPYSVRIVEELPETFEAQPYSDYFDAMERAERR